MADEKFYEQKLTNAIVENVLATTNAKNFIQAAEKQSSLIGSICVKIERLIGVGGNEAKTYINYATGQFKPGKWMPHCVDPELKNLFVQLESVAKEVNKYPYHTAHEANNFAQQKVNQMNEVVAETRKIFGDDKARQIVSRAKAAAIQKTGINF